MYLGNSKRLITASAETTVMLWELETGTRLHTFKFVGPARYVSFAEGEKLALVSVDPFMGHKASIQVLGIDLNSRERKCEFSSAIMNKALKENSNIFFACDLNVQKLMMSS